MKILTFVAYIGLLSYSAQFCQAKVYGTTKMVQKKTPPPKNLAPSKKKSPNQKKKNQPTTSPTKPPSKANLSQDTPNQAANHAGDPILTPSPSPAPLEPVVDTPLVPTITAKLSKKPYVIVEGLHEAALKDVICFIRKKNKKIGCGKVVKSHKNKIMVKVRPSLKRKLEVGMEAVLKKSRSRIPKKRRDRNPSAARKNWKKGSFAYKADVGLGGRYYPTPPLQETQGLGLGYVYLEPQLSYKTQNEMHYFNFHPFYRYDAIDDNRTMGDFRELEYIGMHDALEWRIGIRKVFWGATESIHLVDVINQTDLAGDLDGEDKLGQPMINIAYAQNWFSVDFFLMSFFRDRIFPGKNGRLRPPFRILAANATYESKDKKNNIDAAARLGILIEDADLGFSYFTGNGREPIFRSGIDQEGNIVLVPRYLLVDQLGLDLQWAKGVTLVKLEGIYNKNSEEDYQAIATGLEYTNYGIFESTYDLSVILEYIKDTRQQESFSVLFQNDVFLGTRLSFNDIGLSSVLLGQYYDITYGSQVFAVEVVKRFESSIKVSMDIRGISNTDAKEDLYYLRRDSHANLEIAYTF